MSASGPPPDARASDDDDDDEIDDRIVLIDTEEDVDGRPNDGLRVLVRIE